MAMELLDKNFINTTTQFTVNSNTATVANLLVSDPRFQYASSNFTDDNTTVSLTVNFDQTTSIDRIALVGHNLKKFSVFYNGVTANTFALTSTSNTTTANYLTNSATSHFFRFTAIDCTSVSIDMYSTITPNQNKALGYLVMSTKRTDFGGRVPASANYNPVLETQSVVHRLSDGGTRVQTLEDKWSVSLSFDYVSETTRNELKETFDDHEEMVFCPFGTTTGWDAVIFPCVWQGGFNFFKFSDNATDAGFSGSITLLETPT